MDANFQEKLNELLEKLQGLKSEVEALEVEIQELKASAEEVPAPTYNSDEAIDLTLDDIDDNGSSELASNDNCISPASSDAPVETPSVISSGAEGGVEKSQPEAEQKPKVEETKVEDLPEDLFGEAAPEAKEPAGRRRKQQRPVFQGTIGQKAVIDVMSAKAAWRIDMPGPEVRSLRSAIALGDQVLFINKLFRKDSSLYQTTIDTLNATSTLSEAVRYLSQTFPEWDLESEDVYRFMMAVRRKIRK